MFFIYLVYAFIQGSPVRFTTIRRSKTLLYCQINSNQTNWDRCRLFPNHSLYASWFYCKGTAVLRFLSVIIWDLMSLFLLKPFAKFKFQESTRVDMESFRIHNHQCFLVFLSILWRPFRGDKNSHSYHCWPFLCFESKNNVMYIQRSSGQTAPIDASLGRTDWQVKL